MIPSSPTRSLWSCGPFARRLLFGCLVGLMLSGCGQPAVLNHEEARHVADALYTAVTSKRTDLLRATEKELAHLKEHGEISQAGFDTLTAIIAKADAGQWMDAAIDLDKVIRAEP